MDAIRRRSAELELAIASRTEESAVGVAFFNEELDRVWDLNYLRADSGDAARIAAEADRLQGGAGLAHRAVYVPGGKLGAGLEADFLRLGWGGEENLVMIHAGAPDRPAEAEVEEVGIGDVAGLYRRYRETQAFGADSDTLDQLATRDALVAECARARFFTVREGGEPVSFCTLFRLGEVAQVEDVVTDRDFRGRGYARAVVLRAVEEARAFGAEVIFLDADARDWPRHLYAKLGFQEARREWDFVRRPAISPSSSSAAAHGPRGRA